MPVTVSISSSVYMQNLAHLSDASNNGAKIGPSGLANRISIRSLSPFISTVSLAWMYEVSSSSVLKSSKFIKEQNFVRWARAHLSRTRRHFGAGAQVARDR